MLGHPWKHAGEQSARRRRAGRGASRRRCRRCAVDAARAHAGVGLHQPATPDVRHWYSVGRPCRCVFSSTHLRDADDTANAHSSVSSCSHTTLAPANSLTEASIRAIGAVCRVCPSHAEDRVLASSYLVCRRREERGRRRKLPG
jgi:hypothetical protein